MHIISQLFIYPIKSLGGFEVSSAQLTDKGFKYDRRWMIVDANNRFLTQREHPSMSLLQTVIAEDQLVIFYKKDHSDKVSFSLTNTKPQKVKVTIWEDACTAYYVADEVDEWLSVKLSMQCRLVYMPDEEERKVDERYAHNKETTNFSDGYPLMMIGQKSLDDLNSRLAEALTMDRFRPNIVFAGGAAFDEDIMEHIQINKVDLYGVKLCARCVLTTINQSNATKAKEPLKTLASYRLKNNKIYFGQNLLFKQNGLINVGDIIEIVKQKASEFNMPF